MSFLLIHCLNRFGIDGLMKITLAFVLLFVAFRSAQANSEILAATPPMGWEAWNYAGASCSATNETTIREMADAMVASGMKDAGYEYIRLDECWTGGRD